MNRITAIKAIRLKLKNSNTSIGSWMQIPNSSIAEIMGQSGYEWVAIDMEHGAISHHQLPDIFRALELGNTLPLARVVEGNSKECKQALDAGAGGIIVPMIESAQQLERVRDVCCWPPAGNRGVGFSRANLFGNNFDDYVNEAQTPLLVAMIEHISAVKNIREILQVKGLDAILIGPYDLSASMGITAQFDDERFITALGEIAREAKKFNIAIGIHIVKQSEKILRQRIGEGYQFIAYSMDSVFLTDNATNPNETNWSRE